MDLDEGLQKRVQGWLDDLNISFRDGGVTGPALHWAISMSFGTATHVSIAYDQGHPRRLGVISDLAIAEDHRASYTKLTKVERSKLDRAIARVLVARATISFYINRDGNGAPEKIAMRAFLPLAALDPHRLLCAVHDARNATMELCLTFQDAFGDGSGHALDRGLTDPGYANVILHRGTLETLDDFQIPGETLDETILRAIRE